MAKLAQLEDKTVLTTKSVRIGYVVNEVCDALRETEIARRRAEKSKVPLNDYLVKHPLVKAKTEAATNEKTEAGKSGRAIGSMGQVWSRRCE
jgi:hypothetical protein